MSIATSIILKSCFAGETYALASVMLEIARTDVADLQNFLDEDDVIELAAHPHLTLLQSNAIDALVLGQVRMNPVGLRFTELAVFEKPDYDVLVALVEQRHEHDGSPTAIMDLRTRLLGEFSDDSTYDEYVPHVTIAKLKSGTGRAYATNDCFGLLDQYSFCRTVILGEADGTKSYFDLTSHRSIAKKLTREYERDEDGKFAGDGSGSSGIVPTKKWRDPPTPVGKGASHKRGFGYTSSGHTNTSVGDLGELALRQLDMRSLLPPGRRQNPLDVAYGKSNMAFEVKAVTTGSSEYKVKMKAKEAKSKVKYAKKNGLQANTMILVMDLKKGEAMAYWKKGIGNYRLTTEDNGWNYMGSVKLTSMKEHLRKALYAIPVR